MTVMLIVGSVIAIFAAGYLSFALLFPEKLS